MEKRWHIEPADRSAIDNLQQALKVHPVICEILVKRGMQTFEQCRQFFRPSLDGCHSPWLMKDMDLAVSRVLKAIEGEEKVLIFGDYDVDGTTAVATVYQFLSDLHSNIDFYVPHRYKEGYGISKAGIDFAFENGFSLVIALDCGIKSVDLIAYANNLGIDFIICDHHQPGNELPAAVAILNPKQRGCNYPYKELSGCGVGYKLISAIADRLKLPDTSFQNYLDLVATSIAADIVPITGENRIMAYYGLRRINEQPSAGIKALMQLAACKPPLSINDLVFVIAPRINAAGRMDEAKNAVLLFIEKDDEKALAFAENLHLHNVSRKEADLSITEEALSMIAANSMWAKKKTTVVFQEHWHKGVVGIVASRLIGSYYRPTVVLTKSGDVVAGSARSVAGFNLYEAIDACSEHLIGYGGHFAAAGMTLLPEKVEAFSAKFEEVVAASITDELLTPQIMIDAEVQLRDLTMVFYQIIKQMEPFGPQNMRPVFVMRNAPLSRYQTSVVKQDHIRFLLKDANFCISGIGFGLGPKYHLIETGKPVDIVFTLDENKWNNDTVLQIKVIDLKLSTAD